MCNSRYTSSCIESLETGRRHGRYIDPRRSRAVHARGAVCGYYARVGCSQAGSCARISLPTACRLLARQAGPCAVPTRGRDLRQWLFLAPSLLPEGAVYACYKDGLLAGQVRRQCHPRRAGSEGIAGWPMARHHGVGVPDQAVAPAGPRTAACPALGKIVGPLYEPPPARGIRGWGARAIVPARPPPRRPRRCESD